jgi:hypothetical protein
MNGSWISEVSSGEVKVGAAPFMWLQWVTLIPFLHTSFTDPVY